MPLLWQWASETETAIRQYKRAKKSLEDIFVEAALGETNLTIADKKTNPNQRTYINGGNQ